MVSYEKLKSYLSELLQPEQFDDACPNGLQVQGKSKITNLVTGVTASQALILKAIELKADAILVHHGYFWKNENATIVGMKYQRIKALMDHDINLFAYHLPLDAHCIFGNNALLCQVLGGEIIGRFGHQKIGFLVKFPQAISEEALLEKIRKEINPHFFLAGEPKKQQIVTLAICSGGGQSYYQAAIELGADAFLSGEISEHNVHEAVESAVPYIAAGHHATERFGVRALGAHLAQQFAINVTFVDIDSGV